MPPLSAYTPFESLLFFQCLASLASQPVNFSAISDTLCKNQFVKENDAFDTSRLSPEALEDLYTTLLKEGVDGNSSIGSAEPNGHAQDAANTNSKKRKITSGNASAVTAQQANATILPGLVTQLYARYKDRVTKEIRDEEKRYREIREEIDRLQKEELEKPAEPTAAKEVLPGPAKAVATPSGDEIQVDEKSDVKPKATPTPVAANVRQEGQRQQEPISIPTHAAKSDVPPVPPTKAQEPVPPSKPEVVKQQETPPVAPAPAPPTTAPLSQLQPRVPTPREGPVDIHPVPTSKPTPKAAPLNGKAQPLAPQPPAQHPHVQQKIEVKVPPPPQSTRPPSQTPSRSGPTPSRNQPALPPGSTIVFQAHQGPSLPATPTQRHIPPPSARQIAPVPTGTPIAPNIPPGQQQFQQWSPHAQLPYPAGTIHAPIPHGTPHGPPHGLQMAQNSMIPQQAQFAQSSAGKLVPAPIHGASPITPIPDLAQVPPQTPLPGTPSFHTGVKQKPPRPSMDTVGSLTPWKRTPGLSINIPETPGSPPRPNPADVSPISDRAPSPIGLPEPTAKEHERGKRGQAEGEKPRRGRKRSVPPLDLEKVEAKNERAVAASKAKRAGSTTSTRARARSGASRDEDVAEVPASRKIKDEAPATPAGISDDTEMETRIGMQRKSTVIGRSDEGSQGRGRPKRKRGVSESLDTDNIQPALGRPSASQLIYCTRNFTRTGAPLMNDVSAHKHASIFGKPLTEREAPGYKDLIYRPQDLKTIRSALNQGNKAVAAATEAVNTPIDGESPNPASSNTPSKNAAWLPKTADLIPPKAIVNSSQLEKELIRMFANAVMFNPAPDQERGFGPSFRIGKASDSRSSSQPWELDEGGITRDTREMCDDVENAVTKWRAAERTTAEDLSGKNMFSLRGNSGENVDSTDGEMK
ncbi:Bromodomain-containing protein [Talaromyces proteolyticus]|uniref:Bromodomain-containing protein n=1 Tax=Talaromyces proteolyticus TaxID=1131652 RepID=A0AAD4L5W0_9EURO|nr:Bromodomain-containing protein [Talaromyces proteolyticus]KAH8705676.1 Bromodomain-containing protein [Talaromyces proteolyticus]